MSEEIPEVKKVSLEIAPTTGGSFDFLVDPEDSIDFIKKCIAKKLKVSKEQICLLHRDRLLENSKRVKDYSLADGSRVSLVPSIETGLVTQRPEQSVLEALEGLNESQVGDFLSGKSPLNLTMRLGDHVMLIQLQLSKGQLSSSTTSTPPSPPHSPPHSPQPPQSSSLVEASRNLTNTLKKLSSHVTTTGGGGEKGRRRKRRRSEEKVKELPITNHMQHHGKGVYTGTFSGTLNPALQDGLGKPKKHVSTIVHILNDLLGGVQTQGTSKKAKKRCNAPSSTATCSKELTEEERSAENESLRVKMEQLREQLRVRKEKLLKSEIPLDQIS